MSEAAAKGRWRLFMALFGIVLPGAVTVSLSPLLNAVAMDVRHLSTVEIGAIRTGEILLNGLLALFLSTRLTRIEPRLLGFLGAGLVTLGSLAAIPGTLLWELAAARLVSGAGGACLAAAGAALYGQFASPQRASGALIGPWTIASVAGAIIAGEGAKAHSQTGVFGVLAIAATLAFACILFMPRGPAPAHAQAPPLPLRESLRRPYVIGVGILFFGSTGLWAFFTRLGQGLGLDQGQSGQIIAMGSVLSGLLGVAAVLVRDRWVRIGMLVSVALFATANTTLAFAPSAGVYLFAYAVQSVAYVFATILMPVVGIRLDRTGASNTAATGLLTFLNAFAPLTAGYLVRDGSFVPLGFMCGLSGLLALTFLFIASRSPAARADVSSGLSNARAPT